MVQGLVLGTYGNANNDSRVVRLQQRLGVNAIVTDTIGRIARSTVASPASSSHDSPATA